MRARAVRIPPAALWAGGMRWALRVCFVSLRHGSLAGDGAPALASLVPRRSRPRRPGVQGGCQRPLLVDGCPEGEPTSPSRSKPAPKRRSWSRTRKSWSRVARGRDLPPARWVQGEPKSPWSRCNGDVRCAQPGRARCPSALKRPADQSLGDSAPKERHEPRDFPGGSAGDGKSPRKVSAVLPRTPCTFFE